MTSFIIIVVIVLFIVSLGFTWYRLEAYEGAEKVVIVGAGILGCWIITTFLFSLSSKGLNYTSIDVKNEISKILVLVFTPVNMLAIMPYLTKQMSRFKFSEISDKEFVKNIAILIVLILIVFFIEVNYLTSIQKGIFDIANQI